MALDTTKPADNEFASAIAAYIRENRVAINAFSVGEGFAASTLVVAPGTVTLAVGVDLQNAGFESVTVTGTGAAILTNITGGTHGQVKTFVFQDNNVDWTRSATRLNGTFLLNQPPGDFQPTQDDILTLMNINGDPSTGNNGYWIELYRTTP